MDQSINAVILKNPKFRYFVAVLSNVLASHIDNILYSHKTPVVEFCPFSSVLVGSFTIFAEPFTSGGHHPQREVASRRGDRVVMVIGCPKLW
jgi:hypothetical protein